MIAELLFKVKKAWVEKGMVCMLMADNKEIRLLNAYSDVFTKAALSRITGINQRQLWHYASGMRKPRPTQRKRIEDGLHRLGMELLNIGV